MNQNFKCLPELVQAYSDAQLSLTEALEVERHLQTCERCSASYRNQRALSSAIAESSLYYRAPRSLLERIKGESVRGGTVKLPPELHVRESCGFQLQSNRDSLRSRREVRS